jgi:Zn-dependent M16 (insulinase) family peptidase
MRAALQALWAEGERPQPTTRFTPAPVSTAVAQGWVASTGVNFCAKAYRTVAADHLDAPALAVLAEFLRNGFLHGAVREQGGAYGAGASYSADTGAFRFYSYRDPRLGETLQDFDRALYWLHEHPHSERTREEAILGVISRIDRPESPAGEAINAFFEALHGRTPEHRRRFRQRVLAVTIEDMRRAAARHLVPERASIAVLTDPATLRRHRELGLELLTL